VVVLRRRIRESLAVAGAAAKGKGQQDLFSTVEVWEAGELYEYAVLVTPLEESVMGLHNSTGTGRKRRMCSTS
jgi:hypothetical protein